MPFCHTACLIFQGSWARPSLILYSALTDDREMDEPSIPAHPSSIFLGMSLTDTRSLPKASVHSLLLLILNSRAPGRAGNLTAVMRSPRSEPPLVQIGQRAGEGQWASKRCGSKGNKDLGWSLVVRTLLRPVEPFLLEWKMRCACACMCMSSAPFLPRVTS